MLHLVRTGSTAVVCASLPAADASAREGLAVKFLHSSTPWCPAVVSCCSFCCCCCCCVPPLQLEHHARPLCQAAVLPLLLQVWETA